MYTSRSLYTFISVIDSIERELTFITDPYLSANIFLVLSQVITLMTLREQTTKEISPIRRTNTRVFANLEHRRSGNVGRCNSIFPSSMEFTVRCPWKSKEIKLYRNNLQRLAKENVVTISWRTNWINWIFLYQYPLGINDASRSHDIRIRNV